MIIIILGVTLALFSVMTLIRRGQSNHTVGVKIALLVSYTLLIAQSIEAEHAAVQADMQRLAGGTNGWFGRYWAIMWMLNILAIIGLHIYLFRTRQSKDLSNPIISR